MEFGLKSQRQHFVPKSYLTNFCLNDSKELFRSRFILQRNVWSAPKLKNIEQICYGPDMYDLHRSFANENQVDMDHIEKFAFWYEREFLNKIVQGVRQSKFYNEDIQGLAKFYLSMIARNPIFRDALDEKKIERLVIDEMIKLRENTKFLYEKTGIDGLEELINTQILVRENELLAQSTKSLIHNTALFRQHFGRSNDFDTLINRLNGYKKLFIRISSEEKFFITSDAPGFSLDQSNNVFSFKFRDDLAHYMPISSKIVLAIMHPVYFFQNPEIAIVRATDNFVSFMNRNTFITSKNEVYSEDSNALLEIIRTKK